MGISKLILNKNFLTEKANLDELKFRDSMPEKEEWQGYIKNLTKIINDGRLQYLPFILKKGVKIEGKVIELGAGVCWFSSQISRLSRVNEVYALEFSKFLLSEISPRFMSALNAKEEKITRIQGDFNRVLFGDGTFDVVVIDAALHHATDLKSLLREINRVLKPNGTMIAIREPVIPAWRPGVKAHFGEEDKKRGVTENIYSLKEWKSSFRDCGLRLMTVPFMPKKSVKSKVLSQFMFLNNQLFGHYIFIAKKR